MSLTRLARAEGIALRTAQRWLQRYRTQGLAGLARRPRADLGTTTFPPELIGLIEGLALQRPPPTAAAIHRRVTAVAREQGWPVPSYATVAGVVRRLDPALLTLAHEGTKRYQEQFDLICRREAEGSNTDHGSDFTSQHLAQVAADLKMVLVFSTPGQHTRFPGFLIRWFCRLGTFPGRIQRL